MMTLVVYSILSCTSSILGLQLQLQYSSHCEIFYSWLEKSIPIESTTQHSDQVND